MVRNGLSKTKITEWLKDKYEISDRTAYKLIHDALADLQEATENIDMEKIKAEYNERVEYMCEKAIQDGDLKTALRAQDMLNKMNGLYVEKQEIKAEINTWTFEYGE